MRNFIICTHPQISLGKSSQVKANEVGGACGKHEKGEKSVQGFGGKARRKETTGKTKAKMGSEWMLGRLAWGVWIGFDCLRTGTGGGLL
jgi:hypothetical protein